MDETDEWIVLCTCEVIKPVERPVLSQEVINQAMGG